VKGVIARLDSLRSLYLGVLPDWRDFYAAFGSGFALLILGNRDWLSAGSLAAPTPE
jgi:hypothetical protein